MQLYRKLMQYLSKGLMWLSTAILTVMIVTYLVEIVRRLMIQKSFLWVQELNVILVVWLVFMGAAHVYLSADLLRVDFLFLKAKGLLKLVWSLVIHAVSIYVLYHFIVQGYKYMMHMLPTITNAMEVSYAWYAAPLFLCACFMGLGAILKVYDSFMEYKSYRQQKGAPILSSTEEVISNG